MRQFIWNPVRFALLVWVLISFNASGARSDDWPSREPIHIVVPYAAGSNTDAVGRVVAQYLSAALKGWPVVVENHPGVGGILGTRIVSKSAADGYTLCVCSSGAITIPSLIDKMYDPLADLTPISKINNSALVLLVNSNSSATSVADIVAWSKSKPGGLNYGSSGVGGIMYNSAEIFRNRTGATMTHVSFRGGPEATTALISGQIELVFAIMSDVLGQVAAKTVRPIAITTAARSPLLPDVPTMMEQGIRDYDISLWNGLFAPPGTPKPILDKLSAIMLELADDPKIEKTMTDFGSTPSVSTPAQFRKELREEAARWEADLKSITRN
ncbi:MAG TPA: tripartite tricarboxylate transporter substrate binding protein [Xanthobacteraceae bacterium]|nr:tripartite tricarboxylate transporter substrate binding protein [Xanthobacteraceae bacterium]